MAKNKSTDPGHLNIASQNPTALNINPYAGYKADPIEGRNLVPTQFTFSALWMQASKTFLARYKDQATRDDYATALAMRRDTYISSLLSARRSRLLDADFCIEPEDPEDKEQVAICDKIDKIIRSIPGFRLYKDALLESDFYGIAGVQNIWNYKKIAKSEYFVPTDWTPVQGDKIIPSWELGLYGILVYRGYNPDGATILPCDRGSILMLDKPDFRDQFVFMRFKRQDKDYQFESDLGGNAVSVGLRSELYWYYVLRRSLMDMIFTSFQRISSSGLIYGTYPLGNANAEKAMIATLVQLNRDGVAALGVDPDHPELTTIQSIEPSKVAQDSMKDMLENIEETMARVVIGQTLTMKAHKNSLGGTGASDVQEDTLQAIVNGDGHNLAEALTEDLIEPLRKYNPELQGDFRISIRFLMSPTRIKERMEAAQFVHNMGVALDEQQVLTLAGLEGENSKKPNQKLIRKAEKQDQSITQDPKVNPLEGI